jgi:biotin synthase
MNKNLISVCAIVNAKSGQCAEDCKFCAQSAHNNTDVSAYPLISSDKLSTAANNAINLGASCFGIVTSGNELTEKEFTQLCLFGKNFENVDKLSLSIGHLTAQKLEMLKAAGFTKIHHNLETSRNFFPNICTTHTYDQRINTIRLAKTHGFKVCSGGLFGIGETVADRVDLAFELKNLDVDSIPLNFFVAPKGARLQNKVMPENEILKTIELFRAVNPNKHITVCGGRALLGDKQSLIFKAGASGVMVGDYLTVKGNDVQKDLEMIKKAGYKLAK